MFFRIFILFFIFTICVVNGSNTIDMHTKNPLNILKQTSIYIDKENKKNFDYILKNSAVVFKKNKKDFIHLGYTSDAVWLKFKIKNPSNTKINKVLEISNQMLDSIVLYTKEANSTNYTKQTNGIKNNLSNDENIIHMYFNISLKPNTTKTYYLKISSLSCAVYFDINLMSKDQLYQKEIKHQLVLTLFFGSILTLIIYNLFIFYFTKDLAYLYYISYLLFVIMEHTSYTAINFYVFSKDFLEADIYLAIFYISCTSIFAILFVRKYLNTYKYKKLDFVFKSFIALNIIFILLSNPEFYPIDIVVLTTMLSLLYIIVVGIYLLYKGETNAKYMIVGWSISVFGWLMLGMYDYGGWSILSYYPYFFEFSIFIEAVLFSVALANKLNKTSELEKSLQTNEILTKELHHRVKNNMQFIISIYRLKLSKHSNHEISNSLKEAEGTIQAMSTTHEMLYTQNMSSTLDTKNYFTLLIDRLKQNYRNSDVNISLNITTSLDADKSIYIGIILNELITNSFKYAFSGGTGKIAISLLKTDKNYILRIEDNGKGFDTTKQVDGFGLELVKTLVEDELHATQYTDTLNGCKHIIKWH